MYTDDPNCSTLGCNIFLDGLLSLIYPPDSQLTIDWLMPDGLVIGQDLTGNHFFGLGDDQMVTLRLTSQWGDQYLQSEDSLMVSVKNRGKGSTDVPEPPATGLMLIGLAWLWRRSHASKRQDLKHP